MDLFSFWGYTEDQANRTRVTSLQDLKKNASSILWKKSGLKYVETLSGYLNAGRSLCEQQIELRSKGREMENSGGKTF
jgi:hypothetical protein